eukprot:1764843-Rhodomonas_salina.4
MAHNLSETTGIRSVLVTTGPCLCLMQSALLVLQGAFGLMIAVDGLIGAVRGSLVSTEDAAAIEEVAASAESMGLSFFHTENPRPSLRISIPQVSNTPPEPR